MKPQQSPPKSSPLANPGLLLALCVFAAGVWRSLFLIDDAFISFRYAQNWVNGHGLVYNVGNLAPVEGYSNFAWTALLALGLRLGAPLEVFAHVLSIAAGVGTILLVEQFLRRQMKLDNFSRTLALVALAALPSFHVWASGGLETAFFGLLLFACWTQLCAPGENARVSPGVVAGLLGGLLVLTRAEGFLWIGGLLGAAWMASETLQRKRCLQFLGISLAIGLLHLAFRYSFYGAWLPNTVHAKGSLSGATIARGARTLATWGLCFGWPLLALAAPLAANAGKQRRLARSAVLMIGGGLAYNLAVGGDWMPFFRFMAPLSAFLAICMAVVFARLGKRHGLPLGVLVIAYAALPIFNLTLVPRSLREAVYFREFRIGYQTEWERWKTGTRNTATYTAMGHALAQTLEPQDSWTGGAIGAIGYYSGLQILGRNGLVNREVALRPVDMGNATAGHEKRVPRVWFRDQSPTIYDSLIFPGRIPSSGPVFDQAAQRLFQAFLADPKERGLVDCSTVEAIAIRDIPGVPAPATLLLLKHTSDRKRARDFWSRYGAASANH